MKIALIALLAVTLTGCATTAPTAPATLPPCPTEDSNSCHWDAQSQGDGNGHSFDADEFGNVTYTD